MSALIDKILLQKQTHINDFIRRANAILPPDDPLYFDGHFITGQTDHPDMLFIGINPGHRDWDNLAGRQADTRFIPYENVPCKYFKDAATGNRFARRVINIACGGRADRLNHCAETSLLSYFASPTERVVKAQIKQLPPAMQKEHSQLTHLPLDVIQPRHIVCIGWRTFDEFIKRYGKNNTDLPRNQATKQLPIRMQGVDKMMDYYTKVELEGITVHGVRHFSTPLSRAMLDDMTAIFQDIWADIEKNSSIKSP